MTDPDDAALERLLVAIFEHYHYDFRGYARASLRRRVQGALARFQVASIDELARTIGSKPAVFGELLSWFTVQLSDLFRDPAYFRHFRSEICPVLATYPSRKLWVAGCSTGEEAYSFAIILREEGLLERTLIYATDIHAHSLRIAESGAYDLDRMRVFTENHRKSGATATLAEHYTTSRLGAVFDRGLREHIVFADHSLATDAVFAEVHAVSCRNVLIYFGAELQNRALGLFDGALVRHGWLGIGPKETLEFSPLARRYTLGPERWYRKEQA